MVEPLALVHHDRAHARIEFARRDARNQAARGGRRNGRRLVECGGTGAAAPL
jgi:hypothetical protein